MSRRVTLPVIVALILSGGCRPKWKGDPSYDADRALMALRTCLDAWKAGKAASLAAQAPPIRFGDDDMLAGLKLYDYHLEEPDVPIAPFQDVKLELVVIDARGDPQRKLVTYQIAQEPSLAVLRSDN